MSKHYVLVPGFVYSATDGDKHYITWQQLQRLYQLERHEFSVDRSTGRREIYDPPLPEGKEIVRLKPSFNGRYGRPE
jgi:hypothetical protein